jgi:hypothetical protein
MSTPKKVSELSAITNLSGDDLLMIVNDPNGTPSSKKITHRDFFANVVSETTHRARTTFQANTLFYGSQMTVQANVNIASSLEVDNRIVLDDIDDRLQVANAATLYVTKSQFQANNVASNNYVHATFTTNTVFQEHVSNNDLLWSTLYSEGALVSNTYLQTIVSNNNVILETKADKSVVDASNTALNILIDDRIQVGNVVGVFAYANTVEQYLANTNAYIEQKAPIDSPNFTGVLQTPDLQSNTVTVQSNTGLVLAGGGVTNQPNTSNATNEGYAPGTIWYSNNFLYIAVDVNTIKRVSLDTF